MTAKEEGKQLGTPGTTNTTNEIPLDREEKKEAKLIKNCKRSFEKHEIKNCPVWGYYCTGCGQKKPPDRLPEATEEATAEEEARETTGRTRRRNWSASEAKEVTGKKKKVNYVEELHDPSDDDRFGSSTASAG